MLMLLAAAFAAAPEAAAPQRQAQAVVRIMAAAELRFAEIERDHPNALRSTVIPSTGGLELPARLLEFE